MTARNVIAAAAVRDDTDEITAELWAALSPELLELVNWSDERRVLRFPQHHPVLGWRGCAVVNCDQRGMSRHGFCSMCHQRWMAAGQPPPEGFSAVERAQVRRLRVQPCSVAGCRRPWKTATAAVCDTHHYQQRFVLQLPLAEFLHHPQVVGLPSFGPCEVAACTRDRTGTGPYCHLHMQRIRALRKQGKIRTGEWDEQHWRRTQGGIAADGEISVRGLPDRMIAELLFGLQHRIAQGVKTTASTLRSIGDAARRLECGSLEELDPTAVGEGAAKVLRATLLALHRHRSHPHTERLKNEWDAVIFGCSGGTVRFTGLAQRWLREAAKAWALDDLPRRRGSGVAGTCQAKINSLVQLSESLHLQRQDHGADPSVLSRTDITDCLNRLAFLQREGTISAYQRLNTVRNLRRILERMRTLGLTRPDQPLHRLPDDFAVTVHDFPDDPEDTEAGKDLPVEVMRHLCQHLDLLEAMANRETRVGVELLIDTGRRPDEICRLALDCLERDEQGRPVLVYDNVKSHRLGRRLPIHETTAELIEGQQQRVRHRYPTEPMDRLKLLPSPIKNPHGGKPLTGDTISTRHREWVDALPDILVPSTDHVEGKPTNRMLPFDKKKIFPYVYRHSFAQRHADAGVAVDVLMELMSHRQMTTTQGYYRVGDKRRRDAVDRVTTMQFDRHGNRLWRDARALLDSEHLRRAVGEVAVPYGTCSEPGNVTAGGGECPVRFRCVGCAHFSTDVSYLPDLEAYLADLLRSRERLHAAFAADDWAKAEAMPSDEEITRIRRLLSGIKDDVDELSAEDRAQITEAVSVVRRARNTVVGLGLPRVRQSLPDVRPDRTD
ncbi:tyrosine-type recombinase/integrase [Rhodococcus sp. NPDC060086]|uniref:tyrosine-type recombinase/integrase n=1 Tax=Rhodococcus sp. NPDC060086 TaxID=3347055 RepID=UPI00364C0ADB